MPRDMSHARFVTLELRIPIISKRGIIKLPRFDFYQNQKCQGVLGTERGAGSSSIDLRYIKFLRINVDKMQIL